MKTDRQQPVFIVGCPRSGTTLLAGMLGAHSRMICGPETNFFMGLVSGNLANRLLRPKNWPEEAATYLFSLKGPVPGQPIIAEYYGQRREDVIGFLKERKPSLNAMLESLTETYMTRHGKQRWVEKTTFHIIRGPEIRRSYPNAPIIRILRDPRDVALSMIKVLPWGVSTFVAAILKWQFLDERSAVFFETDRNAVTLRYEDLLLDPEGELRKICQFIGEEFEPGMMDRSASVVHVNREQKPWKTKVGEAVDPSRIAVWRRETTEEQQCQAEALVGDRIKAYEYPTSFHFNQYIQILNLSTLAHFPKLTDHLLDSCTRFWKAQPHERPLMRFFLGDPCVDGWIGESRSDRLTQVFRVASQAAHSLITGIPLMWVGAPPAEQIRDWGLLSRVLAKLLPKRLDVNAVRGMKPEPTGR